MPGMETNPIQEAAQPPVVPFRIGERVMVFGSLVGYRQGAPSWKYGVVEDIFDGPVSGAPIIAVGDAGYYLHEVRKVDA